MQEGYRFKFECSQSSATSHRRSGQGELKRDTQQVEHGMDRFECKGVLLISVHRLHGVAHVTLDHHKGHHPYTRMGTEGYVPRICQILATTPTTRAADLFKTLRAEYDQAGAAATQRDGTTEYGQLQSRVSSYPTTNQIRAILARLRSEEVQAMIDEIGLVDDGPLARAEAVLTSFINKGEAIRLDLGAHAYYDALAFAVPGFEELAKDAVELALDGTLECLLL
jgi:hypothetical protein